MGPLQQPRFPLPDIPPRFRLLTRKEVSVGLLYASAAGVAAGSTVVPVSRKMETPVASGFSSVGAKHRDSFGEVRSVRLEANDKCTRVR